MSARARRLRPLWLLLVPGVAAAAALKHVDHPSWTGKYDQLFRKYSKHYFGPGFDWRWFKSQAIAESNLKPRARNPSGATGIMQILPSTFREIRKKNPHFKSIKEPRWNIAAGIYYDRQLYKRWKKKIPGTKERLNYTLASYNAGFGRINKARKKAGGNAGAEWQKVAPHAPKQTRHYVKKIHGLMDKDR
ncbi:MAG: transglycosylase SLT domain-containing protein [Pseudomonadota bacterium]|nr:transglycosylase SLT domain-containing protein [Pseudomonadota bacterium]